MPKRDNAFFDFYHDLYGAGFHARHDEIRQLRPGEAVGEGPSHHLHQLAVGNGGIGSEGTVRIAPEPPLFGGEKNIQSSPMVIGHIRKPPLPPRRPARRRNQRQRNQQPPGRPPPKAETAAAEPIHQIPHPPTLPHYK